MTMSVPINSKEFCWIGDGEPFQVGNKHRNKVRYKAFGLGSLKIGLGEFVLVRNDDALDPEDITSCYIAQIKDLYDTGSEIDPFKARVQWYSRTLEIPAFALKLMRSAVNEFEVVKDKRSSWSDVVDAETIFQKCEVLFLDPDADYESALFEYCDHPFPVFFCRYLFTGKSILPVKDASYIFSQNKSIVSEYSDPNGNMFDNEVQNGTCSKINNLYCANLIGSPSKVPRVLIKRISDKILDAKNKNIRIFVADSNAKDVNDVADIFLSKLKLEKEQNEEFEKMTALHNLDLKNKSEEDLYLKKEELMGNDLSVDCNVTNTLKISKNGKKKNESPLSNVVCQNLFSYNTRNSPRKNRGIKNSDSSPPKKLKLMQLDQVRLGSKFSNRKLNEKSPIKMKNLKNISKKLSLKENRSENNKKTPVKSFRCIKNSSPVKNYESSTDSEVSDSEIMSDKQDSPRVRKSHASKNVAVTPQKKSKKLITDCLKSPKKSVLIENSSNCCTPKKKTKLMEMVDDFCLTRSGRRVKAINYAERENLSRDIASISTPTKKKLPHYVKSYSESSDSDVFDADTSDSDSSQSSLSSLDENLSSKAKNLKRNKKASKKLSQTAMSTPSTKKRLINLSIPERKTPSRIPKNALEETRQRLHVSAVPSSLPCRDEEYSDIYTFVKGCLLAQTGGCMYISGVPGTGKTATVHEVMRNLEEEKESGEVPIFTFVEVNGMWMTDPYQCYVQIFKGLTEKTVAPQQAAELLEKRFTERGPKKDAVVLLVDELDRLWTRKQTVMYNIFDWPTKQNSKLIVLAIANTMDLPERMMMNRISSRLGLTRKTFQPYTFKQLQEIIMSRIKELNVFDPDAVQLVARKVAAVSGDARRALDICRFATETVKATQTAKKSQKVLVGMEHVDMALQQMFSSPVISAIRSSSKVAKIFFQCVLSEFTRTGLEETILLKVHRQVVSVCRFEGMHPPNSTEIIRICVDLAASHLILVDNFRNNIYMKIRLNVSSDDVTYALSMK